MANTVTKATRAPSGGKLIQCPHCNNSARVFHFSWASLQCPHCKALVPKHEWLLSNEPAEQLPTTTSPSNGAYHPPHSTMKLTETQAKVLQLVSNAEMRGRSQMLSLLLAEGVRFYFFDRAPFWHGVELNVEEAVKQLEAEAMAAIQAD